MLPPPSSAPTAPRRRTALRHRFQASRLLARLAMLLAGAGLAGCTTTGYYWQAVSGHFDLMRRRRPIDQLLADPATPAELRERLRQVQAIRRYAVSGLGLPDNLSYTSYAALDRPFVIWNVFAAPPLATTPREWCFPVAGCVAYRGYFQREAAEAMARQLRENGDDTYVGGVPAYSTLGWMNDPVLSTFIHWPEPEIARLLFHELAHQVAYAGGDSAFNEAFATAVEEEGVARWIRHEDRPGLAAAWVAGQQHRLGFLALVEGAQHDLADLYASRADEHDKLAGKQARIARLRSDYQALKLSWGGWSGYDHWFVGDINNAQLASLAIYTAQVPAFGQLLAEQGGDLPRFYALVKKLAAAPQAQRSAAVAQALSRVPASVPPPDPAAASAAASWPGRPTAD